MPLNSLLLINKKEIINFILPINNMHKQTVKDCIVIEPEIRYNSSVNAYIESPVISIAMKIIHIHSHFILNLCYFSNT